ncbi:hypothetical protein BJY04DRAFT_195629 [Aspergillus karnatakaensis]|uniref:uncharacterized protein n=1 Tax=Aspergillus karnatakaensis TaxID=1810916 RepID=UPI003CCCCBEC
MKTLRSTNILRYCGYRKAYTKKTYLHYKTHENFSDSYVTRLGFLHLRPIFWGALVTGKLESGFWNLEVFSLSLFLFFTKGVWDSKIKFASVNFGPGRLFFTALLLVSLFSTLVSATSIYGSLVVQNIQNAT